jgi:hypothetical protein
LKKTRLPGRVFFFSRAIIPLHPPPAPVHSDPAAINAIPRRSEPRSLRDLSTGRNVRNFVIHRSYPRAAPLPLPARQLHYVKFDAHDKTHYTPQDKQHDKTHDTERPAHARENQNPNRSTARQPDRAHRAASGENQ